MRARLRRALRAGLASLLAASVLAAAGPAVAQNPSEQPAGTVAFYRQLGAPSAAFAVLLAIVEVDYLRPRGTDLNHVLISKPEAAVIAVGHALSEQVRYASNDPARHRIARALAEQFGSWLAAVDRLRQRRGLPPWNGQHMMKLATEAVQGQHDASVLKTFGVARGRAPDMFASMAKSGITGLLTAEDNNSIKLLEQEAPRVANPPPHLQPQPPVKQPPGCPSAEVVGAWWLKSRYMDKNLKYPIVSLEVRQTGACNFVLGGPAMRGTVEFRYNNKWVSSDYGSGPEFVVTGPANAKGKRFAAIHGTDGRTSICPMEHQSCLYRNRSELR